MSINSVKNDSIGQDSVVNAQKPIAPTITNYSVDGVDDEALDPAGGQTVLINGSGFQRGATVTFDGSAIAVVSWVSSSQLSFTAPAKSAGTYNIYVVNSDGGTAIYIPGIIYSTFPTWTTAQGTLGSYYETQSISNSVVATGDAPITYSVVSGSLPSGATLASDGTITGTSPAESGSTTYSFTVQADDAELQSSTRSFSLTINTDVVTWVTPSSGATINLDGTSYSQELSATDAAGYSVSYSANALPTGLTLSSGTISGTPTTEETVSTLLTATAATTNRTSTNTITWVVSLSDAYWKYNTLLLSADSSIQPSSFVSDDSINNAQLTVFGDTRASNFNPYQQGYYSNYFDGTGDYLTVADNSLLEIGLNTDFTVEFWFNASSRANAYNTIFSKGASGIYQPYYFSLLSSGNLAYWSSSNGTAWNIANSVVLGAPSLNQWHHVAVSRQSTNTYLFLNGTLVNTISNSGAALYNNTTALAIGARSDNTEPFNGYVSNARIVNGTGLYAASFTPSATPLLPITNTVLLTCQSNRLIDNSVNNFTITKNGDTTVSSAHPFSTVYQAGTQYYATKFDGTGDKISIATNSAFTFGTNDFTIECWFNISSATASIFDLRNTIVQVTPYIYAVSSTLRYYVSGADRITSSTLTPNTWYHLALVRVSGVTKMYLNGQQTGSSYTDTNNYISNAVNIGGAYAASQQHTGLISNLRVVKGVGVYTGAFTPPTSTLQLTQDAGTNISAINSGQTVLLTCQDSTIKDNSTNNFTITGSGDAVPIAVSPFTPSSYTNTEITTYGSAYFDGTGDYIRTSSNSGLAFGTGDFTIECWVNLGTGAAAYASFFTTCPAATYNGVIMGSDVIGISGPAGGGGNLVSVTFAVNTWTHVALTRAGTTMRVFLNGVLAGSATNSTDVNSTLGTIGARYVEATGYLWTGYISDLRIIKGSALYTSNFVPQFTSPLTNVTNTQLLTLQTNGSHNNSTFKDQSSFNNVITRNGNTTNGTFSPYGDNWSNYFDGSGDYISASANALFAFGTGNFTIEAWINYTGALSGSLVPIAQSDAIGSSTNNKWFFAFNNANLFFNTHASGGFSNTIVFSPTVSTWYHVAVTRTSGTIRMFINGESKTVTTTGTPSGYSLSQNGLVIGGMSTPYYMTGYISNFRMVTGSSLYSSSFTPSTTPLTVVTGTSLLTCQSNRLIDNSNNNFTLTRAGDVTVQKFSPFSTVTIPKYYSTYFDGTGDYLTTPSSANSALNPTNGFTLEGWVYFRSNPTYQFIVSSAQGAGAFESYWFVGTTPGGNWRVSYGDASAVDTGTPITLNRWTHFALSCSSSNVKFFADGVQISSVSKTQQNISMNLILGTYAYGPEIGSYGLNGSLSNVRYINGQQLYTSNFTPSTTPLTSVSGTSLLTCQDNTFKDNSTNNFTITATGDVKPLQVSPFTPTANSATSYSPTIFSGSMYFDGSGDYLKAPQISFGTSDFTIECWSYLFAKVSSVPAIFSNYETWTTGALALFAGHDSANTTTYNVSSNGTFPVINAGTINYKQWQHLALVRSGTTLTLFVDGVAVGNSNVNGVNYTGVGTSIYIGTAGDAVSAGYIQGYLSDYKITRGVALHTSNFYPGAAPLTPTTTIGANTYSSSLLLSGTSGGVIDATRTVDLETVADSKVTNFSPYNGTYYSNYFTNGTGSLSFPANAALQLGTSAFTIEAWVYNDGSWATDPIIESRISSGNSGGYAFGVNSSGYLFVYNSESFVGTGNIALSTGTWYHVALVREGTGSNQTKFYVNGQPSGAFTLSANLTDASAVVTTIGDSTSGGENWGGYISNLRMVKNQAIYTGAFTPSTSPLTSTSVGTSGANVAASITGTIQLLTCQSNKFIDNSTNNFTATTANVAVKTFNPFQVNTGQSYYFDGTGDYLALTGPAPISTTGNFTLECWINIAAYPAADASVFYLLGGSSGYGGVRLGVNSSGGIFILYSSTGSSWAVNSGALSTLTTGAWYHVALTRNGTSGTLWLNGSQIYTFTYGTLFAGTYNLIGAHYNGVYVPLNFYISDARITNGYARYTTAFTPPTTTYKLN